MRSLMEQLNDLLACRLPANGKLGFFVRTNRETRGALVEIQERRDRLTVITLAHYHVDHALSVRRVGAKGTTQTADARELEQLLRLDIEERCDNLLAMLTERRTS